MARPSVLALVATRAHAVLAATVAMAPVAPVATAPTMAATVATRQAVALVQTVATTAPVLVALAPVLEQVLAPALALATAPVKSLVLVLVAAAALAPCFPRLSLCHPKTRTATVNSNALLASPLLPVATPASWTRPRQTMASALRALSSATANVGAPTTLAL